MLAVFFGMAVYCIVNDRSSKAVGKSLWFLLFFLTGPLGSIVYYFDVYRYQLKQKHLACPTLVNSPF